MFSGAVHLLLLLVPMHVGGSAVLGAKSASKPIALRLISFQLPSVESADLPPVGLSELSSFVAPAIPTVEVGKQSDSGVILPSETTYFPIAQLSVRPQVLRHVELEDAVLKDRHEGGRIRAVLWIARNGAVDQVEIEQSDLPLVYVNAVVAGFLNARFSPGIKDGVPVGSKLPVEVEYHYIPQRPVSAQTDAEGDGLTE